MTGDKFSDKYILDSWGEPVPTDDLLTWGVWFENSHNKRIVKQEYVGKYWVSTVFLGLNHRFDNGPPILWETMVFVKGGRTGEDVEMARCSGNREHAEAMHLRMVQKVRSQQSTLCVVIHDWMRTIARLLKRCLTAVRK